MYFIWKLNISNLVVITYSCMSAKLYLVESNYCNEMKLNIFKIRNMNAFLKIQLAWAFNYSKIISTGN